MYVYVHVYVDLYVYVHVYVYVYLYVYVHVPKVAQEVPPVSLFCALQSQMKGPQGGAWPRNSPKCNFLNTFWAYPSRKGASECSQKGPRANRQSCSKGALSLSVLCSIVTDEEATGPSLARKCSKMQLFEYLLGVSVEEGSPGHCPKRDPEAQALAKEC